MPLTTGNDSVSLTEGPSYQVNSDSSHIWTTQTFDGLAGTDTININDSSTMTSYFTWSMSHDAIFSITSASGGSSQTLSFVNFEKVVFWDIIMDLGTAGNDSLHGTTSSESIYGFDGNDTIDGVGGKDTLYGMAGNDTYVLHSLNDLVVEKPGEGIDTIKANFTYSLVDTDGAGSNGGNVENLTLTGSGNINGTGNVLNNTITGNAGNNTLDGGAGNDRLSGGAGLNTLIGGTGNDTYVVTLATDVVVENPGEGADKVISTISYTLGANVERLTLSGAAAINGTGNTVANVIVGNAAANIITGGRGADMLTGGGGADTFDFNALADSPTGTKHDKITDFQHGIDHIDLSTIDANTTIAGNQAFTFLSGLGTAFDGTAGEVHFVTSGANTMVEVDVNGDKVADMQIELYGSIALDAGDFIL